MGYRFAEEGDRGGRSVNEANEPIGDPGTLAATFCWGFDAASTTFEPICPENHATFRFAQVTDPLPSRQWLVAKPTMIGWISPMTVSLALEGFAHLFLLCSRPRPSVIYTDQPSIQVHCKYSVRCPSNETVAPYLPNISLFCARRFFSGLFIPVCYNNGGTGKFERRPESCSPTRLNDLDNGSSATHTLGLILST